jgi:methylase of polypeptide subunit release factors
VALARRERRAYSSDHDMGTLDALRLALMTRSMKAASGRRGEVTIAGLRVIVAEDVCNPAPMLGLSFAPLFEAALEGVQRGEAILDVGTGSGVWALMAARSGAQVTATDLPHVPLDAIAESARINALDAPRCLHGDLFAPVEGERFDRVLFNPPFHFGTPKDDSERAYLGGEEGEVVRRFLAELPAHLRPSGRAFLIVPRIEQRGYASDLARFTITVRAHRFLPVLGRAELLELAPR